MSSNLPEVDEYEHVEVVDLLAPYTLGDATKILRAAVLDHGCDKDIVQTLVQTALSQFDYKMDGLGDDRAERMMDGEDMTPPCKIDFKGKQLRAWGNAAKKRGDPKGSMLLKLMNDGGRVVRTQHKEMTLMWEDLIS
ncbi:hypothetical protein LTR95_010606 [Oleoguttula sp. CCFEE 5521]